MHPSPVRNGLVAAATAPVVRAVVSDRDGRLLQFTRPYREVLAGAVRSVAGEARRE